MLIMHLIYFSFHRRGKYLSYLIWEPLQLVCQLLSLWDYSGGKPSPTCWKWRPFCITECFMNKKFLHLKYIQASLCNSAVDGFSCTVMWFHDYILSIKLNKFII